MITENEEVRAIVYLSFAHLARHVAAGRVTREDLNDPRACFYFAGRRDILGNPGVFERGGAFSHLLVEHDEGVQTRVQAEVATAIAVAEAQRRAVWADGVDSHTIGQLWRLLYWVEAPVLREYFDKRRIYPHVVELRALAAERQVRLVFDVL